MSKPFHWLVVAEEDILPATTGGRVDQVGFLDAALAGGVRVSMIVPSRDVESTSGYADRFPGARVTMIPRDERLRRQLSLRPYVVTSRPVPSDLVDRLVPEIEVLTAVVSLSIRVAHIGQSVARLRGLPHLVRCQNLESQYFLDISRSAPTVRRIAYRVESLRLRRLETALNRSPFVTAFSDVSGADATAHALRTAKPVVHVPVFALSTLRGELAVPDLSYAERSGVLFVGSLDVETNVAALEWLLDDVWAAVRTRHPDAVLSVVGRRPSGRLRRRLEGLREAGVVLHADVPDVSPHFRRAAVAVNPVRTGAGISVKLLHSVAAGCASVSTSAGASGLDWIPGRHLIVKDPAEQFAEAVGELLANAAYREEIATAGRAFVREELDPQANLEKLQSVLEAT